MHDELIKKKVPTLPFVISVSDIQGYLIRDFRCPSLCWSPLTWRSQKCHSLRIESDSFASPCELEPGIVPNQSGRGVEPLVGHLIFTPGGGAKRASGEWGSTAVARCAADCRSVPLSGENSSSLIETIVYSYLVPSILPAITELLSTNLIGI